MPTNTARAPIAIVTAQGTRSSRNASAVPMPRTPAPIQSNDETNLVDVLIPDHA